VRFAVFGRSAADFVNFLVFEERQASRRMIEGKGCSA
jgi:hypothetical protein